MVQEVSLVPNSSPPVVAKTTLITIKTKPINASATTLTNRRTRKMAQHQTQYTYTMILYYCTRTMQPKQNENN